MMFEEDEQMNAIEDEPENTEMAIPLTADFQQISENVGDEGNTDTVIVESDLSNAILADSPPRVMPPPRPISKTGQLIVIPLKLKSDGNQLMLEFPHKLGGEDVNVSIVSISKPVAQPQKTVIKETKSFDTKAGHHSVAPANVKVLIQAGSSKTKQKIMTIKQAQQLGLLGKGPTIVSSVWKLIANNRVPDQPPKMIPAEQRNSTDVVKKTSAKRTVVKLANQINPIPIPSANQVSIVVLPGKRRQNAISSELGASTASTSQKKCKVETNTPTLIKTAQSPKFTNKLSGIKAPQPWSCSKLVVQLCNCKYCLDNRKNESRRQEATKKYHASNPSVFRLKITTDKASGPDCNCQSFPFCEHYCLWCGERCLLF